MSLDDALLLVGVGLFAGLVNTLAGGGSLLTLPALIFTGLDANSANATNRIAVLLQSLTATWELRRVLGGHASHGTTPPSSSDRAGRARELDESRPSARGRGGSRWRAGIALALPTCVGAAIGATVASATPDRMLRIIIAAVMVLALVLAFARPESMGRPLPRLTIGSGAAMFALGLYGGFLQAGIGIVLVLYLAGVHRTDLVVANAFKVAVVAALTLVALIAFVVAGSTVDVVRGLVLGLASAAGASIGARLSLKKGATLIRFAVIIAVLGSAAKLIYDLFASR